MKKINLDKIRKIIIVLIIVIILGGSGFLLFGRNETAEYIGYKNFAEEIEKDSIEKAVFYEDRIEFVKKNDEKVYYTENPESNNLQEKLLLKGIKVEKDRTLEKVDIALSLFVYAIFVGGLAFGVYKLVSMSRKDFKIVKHTNVKFSDIAGMDELKQEMMKVVEVLKSPEEFKKKGIRQTKGIILEGNPGNGKTLFAKALAQEANVNFIATKGADFQSAMMSIGSRKIKMLFKIAKKHRPCIIFIDEFDGIGERRNYAGTGVDKENNRIITAMLNEMDGFESGNGVLVIAATNSYSSLDPALIRPGRFDLKYTISNPDFNTRIKLIELYTKNKKLSEELTNSKLADAFENLSSSAIETILNEASMMNIINGRNEIDTDTIIIAARKTNLNINIRKLKK